MIFFDTETVGYHGPIVLIQWAEDDGPVHLHHCWYETIDSTLDLITFFVEHKGGVCGFNLAYDWFHIQRMYNVLAILKRVYGGQENLGTCIREFAKWEAKARDGQCVKPQTALDLLLFARRGPYQSTMDRKSIRVKKVPRVLANELCHELYTRVELPEFYFAKRKKKISNPWQINDIKYPDGRVDGEFVDVVLNFAASAQLKVIWYDAVGQHQGKEAILFEEFELERPKEHAWAPYATAVSSEEEGWKVYDGKRNVVGYAWPGLIERYMFHWKNDPKAKAYASDDVTHLQDLYEYFGRPPAGDNDSILACQVGSVRWKGFAIDKDKMEALVAESKAKSVGVPQAPNHVYRYLAQVMTKEEIEQPHSISESTAKVILQGIAKWKKNVGRENASDLNDIASNVGMDSDNGVSVQSTVGSNIKGGKNDGVIINSGSDDGTHVSDIRQLSVDDFIESLSVDDESSEPHPAAIRAQECLDARQHAFKVNMLEKMLIAGRFHASASVIGSLSGRQSGSTETKDRAGKTSGLNALGIEHSKEVRSAFTMVHECDKKRGFVYSGGDFVSFEVSIAEAKYNDTKLREDLLTCRICKDVRDIDTYDDIPCPKCKSFEGVCVDCGEEDVFTVGQTCPACGGEIHHLEQTLQKFHGLFAQSLYPDKSYDDILATKGKKPDLYDQGKRGGFSKLYGGNWYTLVDRLGVDEETARESEKRFDLRYEGSGECKKDIERRFCSMKQPEGIGSKVIWDDPDEYAVSLTGFKRYFTLENMICKILFDLAHKPPKHWMKVEGRLLRREHKGYQKPGGAIMSAVYAAAFQIQGQNMRAAANHEIQSTGAEKTKELQCALWELQPCGISDWMIYLLNVHDELQAPMHESIADKAISIINSFIRSSRKLIPLIKMDWSRELNSWADK